jgi:O-antigen/teichoic acid export membrane protein
MKSIMYLVVVNLAIELYSLVDITMMNFICSKDSIAFYKYGRSIESILMQIVNTFTMVLVPRISFYYKEKMYDEYNNLLSKGLKIIIFCGLPMIVGLYYTSDSLMTTFYGNQYIASSLVLKILSLLLCISPIGYLLGSRVLLVVGRERMMVLPVGVGAVVNVVGNAIVIPIFAEVGAAMASVFSEIIVMVVYVNLGKKYFKLVEIWESTWKIGLACFLMAIYLFCAEKINLNCWMTIGLKIIGATIVYSLVLFLLREPVFREAFKKLKNKIKY